MILDFNDYLFMKNVKDFYIQSLLYIIITLLVKMTNPIFFYVNALRILITFLMILNYHKKILIFITSDIYPLVYFSLYQIVE